MSLKNQAHATRINYIRGVRDLMLNLGKLPENCTVDELKAYLVRQRDELNYSSSTVNLRVSISPAFTVRYRTARTRIMSLAGR